MWLLEAPDICMSVKQYLSVEIADRKGHRTRDHFLARIATVFLVLLIVLDPLPFFFHIDPRLQWDRLFLGLMAIPMFSYILIASSLLKGEAESRITHLRTATAYTMAFGCLVYAVGVLT